MTELPDNATLVELFNAHLSLEKGLSANTVASYDNDVQKLLQFLDEKNERLPSVTIPGRRHASCRASECFSSF